MSGGSYEYLCFKTDDDFVPYIDGGLARMADRLIRLGYAQDAAAETLSLIADLNAARIRADVARRRLNEVWRAIEWWDSCDSGEDAVRDALTKYRSTT